MNLLNMLSMPLSLPNIIVQKSFEAETYSLRNRCQENLLEFQKLIIVREGVVKGSSNSLLLRSVLTQLRLCVMQLLPSTMASEAHQSEPLRILVKSTRSGL